MTVWIGSITASTDDAHVLWSTASAFSIYNTHTNIYVGSSTDISYQTSRGFLRFSIPLNPTDILASVWLKVKQEYNPYDVIPAGSASIQIMNISNASAFTLSDYGAASSLYNYPVLTGSVMYKPPQGNDIWISGNIYSPFSLWMTTTGYTKDNYIGIKLKEGGETSGFLPYWDIFSYDKNPSSGVQLEITYTLGGGPTAWSQVLSETFTLGDSSKKADSILKADTAQILDYIRKNPGQFKSETLALADSIRKADIATKAETVTFGDYFTRIASYIRTQPETLSVTDSQRKTPFKTFVETR